METYLDALDLEKAIDKDYEVPPLPNNLTNSDQELQREENQEVKGEGMSILSDISNHFHSNYVSKVIKRNLGLITSRKNLKEMSE